ncbi:MAG: lysophospholipid acyltransferase family protein [Planctomycetia bacterium]
MAGLGKRLLASRAAQATVGLLVRAYRPLHFGGLRVQHDPRLSEFLATRQPAVFACWHQDFFWTVGYLSRSARRRPTRVLASASRDGGLMAAAARASGFRDAIRGSSARGGAGALRALRRTAASGRESLVIVCDGPRPPGFVLQPGALDVASRSGLPLWFVRTSYRPARVLGTTWARFVLVPPWARAVVRADGPVWLPAGLSREALEAERVRLEARWLAMVREADAALGVDTLRD